MSYPDPTFDVAHGDKALSRQIADTLRLLGAKTSDPALKRQVDAALTGELGIREFARTDVFSQVLDRVAPAALTEYLAMSDEERQTLAEQGEAELQRYRTGSDVPSEKQPPSGQEEPETDESSSPPENLAAHVIPGTRKPNRERIVTPEEPDEEDLFFQERWQNGWLK